MGLRDSLKALVGVGANAVADWVAEDRGASLGGEDFAKAASTASDRTKGALPSESDADLPDPQSMFWDPFAIIEQLGFKERPTQITYGTLRAIVFKVPIVQGIIGTRLNQVASFAQPQHDRYDLGFRIRLRDAESTPTKADKKYAKELEALMMHNGVHEDPRKRGNLETFLRKLAWDSLVYDQTCFEVVPNPRGVPSQWYPVDASTVRIADTASAYYKKAQEDDTKYVQIYDGMIVTEYTEEELCFGIRNPRTDMKLYGYGTSELEMMMTAITSMLWSWQYNQRFFSQGSAQKGLLNFKGAIPEKQMKSFRRHWYTMLSGVENAWRTPITNADEIQWVKLQDSNRDMEFSAWMDFLIKVVCGMYNMDPIELNFQYGNTGQKSTMNEGDNKWKITLSKERGLRPLLRFLATIINRHIVWPINDNFSFEFVGLDAKTQEEVVDMNVKRVKTTRMVDELRAEDDLAPLPDGKGAVILDPTWVQWAQMKDAEKQGIMPGQEPGEGGGFPGADAGEENGAKGKPVNPAEEGEDTDPFAGLFDGMEPGDEDAQKSLKKAVVDITL